MSALEFHHPWEEPLEEGVLVQPELHLFPVVEVAHFLVEPKQANREVFERTPLWKVQIRC